MAGGLVRGQVFEAYGPPGVGKTSMGMQAAANTLHGGDSVVWIDTAHPVVWHRLSSIVSGYKQFEAQDPPSSPPEIRSTEVLLSNLHHYTAPTLPHVLALLGHPAPSFPPPNTGLVVIDNISSIFATAFPRAIEGLDSSGNGASNKSAPRDLRPEALQWASGRRWAVMADFTARMSKFASVHRAAILMLSQTSTKVNTEYGALLRPALSTKGWLENVNTRVVVFRDFLPAADAAEARAGGRALDDGANVRFVGIVKHAGVVTDILDKTVPFIVTETGLRQIELPARDSDRGEESVALPILPPPSRTQLPKRKHEEIADSEGEEEELRSDDFAWIEDDPLVLIGEQEEKQDEEKDAVKNSRDGGLG